MSSWWVAKYHLARGGFGFERALAVLGRTGGVEWKAKGVGGCLGNKGRSSRWTRAWLGVA
jgi:hypothetical protein